ncbi:MAG TPA: nitroreductase family protein, partial [Candidatus Limivivens merdigallinarum]|nr:nitroreductase family protein [Candidatus Limivivens merdigallinarum]
MIPAIYDRRSIRKFLSTPISRLDLEEIIKSAVKAPSSKNRQPWKYIVVQGEAKEEMLQVFRKGIVKEETGNALLPKSKRFIAAAKYTADI